MAFSLKSVRLRDKNLPWFIFIKDFNILITSPTIPTSITDSKKIVYAEVPIIGKNYKQKIGVRNENRVISFTLPIINRNGILGNSNIMKAFDIMRNADNPSLGSLVGLGKSTSFSGVPKVIYSWGTHSIPMEYFVNKCDYEHNSTLTNSKGFSQYTNVSMELELDETSLLYKADRVARVIQARLGIVNSIKQVTGKNGSRPY
jgi:hypothetical protein